MMFRIRTALAVFFVYPTLAMAQAALDRDDFVKTCRLTPPSSSAFFPGERMIVHHNNLIQPAGKSAPARGEWLTLTGRVFDQRCIPLAGAKVDLWQADADGQYRLADAGALSNPYPVFAGTGQTITDNNGQFVFQTVFPGPVGGQAPNVGIRISHPYTRQLIAKIYFSGDGRNEADRAYGGLPSELRPLVAAEMEPPGGPYGGDHMHAHIDLTVAGSDGFRQF